VGDNGFLNFLILNYFFPNFCYTQNGNRLEEKLAKLGSRPHVNLKKKESFYIFSY
jgi:hypothetical protein